MYSTCLFCTRSLGTNEVLETLPIGRRLAFDGAQGRLWIVCPSCAKWNLVPFDTRLETIDACERIFRDTRTRFSTDNIGLARSREGLELVRIGPALRPEFAAWRYGDRFASRRRRNIIIAATAGAALVGGVVSIGAMAGGGGMMQFVVRGAFRGYERFRVATRFVRESGGPALTLSRSDVKQSQLVRIEGAPGGWGLRVPERSGIRGGFTFGSDPKDDVTLIGADAVHGLSQMLPVIAGTAGSKRQVGNAVSLVEHDPTLDAVVLRHGQPWKLGGANPHLGALGKMTAEPRLAMEMLANEDAERRWLEGELKLLERQWREADRLAQIADRLTVPASVDEELAERRALLPRDTDQ